MIGRHTRFVDLFTGSASVAWHVSQRYPVETLAFDLQRYSAVLAAAVIQRERPVDSEKIWSAWIGRATPVFDSMCPPEFDFIDVVAVKKARKWSCVFDDSSLINAYGGHYYSPVQVCWIQALRETIPTRSPAREVCLAALIMAASKCAASPGHTAQPFQPTDTAIKYVQISWQRDFCADVKSALSAISPIYAKVAGKARVGDANKVVGKLLAGDLVFIDPPYSAVQYSRFYHVLEAISVGSTSQVFGVGRYPPIQERPSSEYSRKSAARFAMQDLLVKLAKQGVSAIITFPDHECSNGIDANMIKNYASDLFVTRAKIVSSVFSTLGGPALIGQGPRYARMSADEMILCLDPK